MKVDVWDLIKRFGAIVGLIGALTGWYITYSNFKDYVDKDKVRYEKVEEFMDNQNSINERALVLYDMFIHGIRPGAAEGEAEEGETAEARGPYRDRYHNSGSEYPPDEGGYYALETGENSEGIGSYD